MADLYLEKKTRNVLAGLLFLGWALGNLDRYLMNYAIVYIGKDLSLTATETGLVLSSFFLGYAIMQMPGGVLADRFGAKRVLLIAVIVWSIFTGLTAIAWSLSVMVIIRFLFGIGEGGFQPSASKLISTYYPVNERSKVMSIMLSSGGIMSMLVPIIFGSLINFYWMACNFCYRRNTWGNNLYFVLEDCSERSCQRRIRRRTRCAKSKANFR